VLEIQKEEVKKLAARNWEIWKSYSFEQTSTKWKNRHKFLLSCII